MEEGQECASLLSKRTMREQRDLPPPGSEWIDSGTRKGIRGLNVLKIPGFHCKVRLYGARSLIRQSLGEL